MERHIQRLENDIENFPKTDDKKDKFVEKLSISFSCFLLISHIVLNERIAEVESRHVLAICRLWIVHQRDCAVLVFSRAGKSS